MIRQVHVKNYRSLADIDIHLEPLTVLVGQNGSGKSSLVDVLRFVSDALRLGLKTALSLRAGMRALRRWSADDQPFDIEIALTIQNGAFDGSYRFILAGERRGGFGVKEEACSVQRHYTVHDKQREIFDMPPASYSLRDGKWEKTPEHTAPAAAADTLALPLLAGVAPYKMIYDVLTGMSFYTIFPKTLRDHQEAQNPYPLDETAGNLASQLDSLSGPARLELKQAIQSVLPDTVDYRVQQAGSRLVIKLRHASGEANGAENGLPKNQPWFELAQESDGALRMLALLAALHQQPPRHLIALEEPELTVHPGAIARLWEEIVRASQHSQILLTTHSPDLLDLCAAEQLRVVEKIGGVTYIGPVDQAQKEIIREKLFTPGQLMQAQGLVRAEGAEDGAQ